MKRGIDLYGVQLRRSVEQARLFRRNPTRSEELMWSALRGGRLSGLKFRRQHPIGPFIADFYCPQLGLVVEVDGAVHDGQKVRDGIRQRLIEERRIRFLRLSSAEVERDLQGALRKVLITAAGLGSSHPFPASGEGVGG